MLEQRIPHITKLGTHYDSLIYTILTQERTTREDTEYFNPLALDTVMGFPLPSWQRAVV